MNRGDIVSVYSDVESNCRRGLTKPFHGKKLFVGNGKAKMSRNEIFGSPTAPR